MMKIIIFIDFQTFLCSQPGPFTVSISLADNYITGDDITCNVTITNTHDQPLHLLKRNTPLEGLQSHVFTITIENNKPIQYDGYFFKRMQPSADEFALVPPGKSLTASVDLTTVYSLHKEGVYVVTYDADVVFTDSENFTKPETFKRQHIVSSPAKFQLLKHHSKGPKLPVGELHRQLEALSLAKSNYTKKIERLGANGPISPLFSGRRSSSDESTAKSAYSLAFQKAQVSPSYISSNLGVYSTWFGSQYTSYISTVQGNYNKLYSAMTTKSFTLYFYGPSCKTNVFAYTYFNSQTIYLCSAYVNAPWNNGHDTKYGTLVHEMTHAVAYTEDLAYGEYDIKNLAALDPRKAIQNADNYEYFVEVIA